MRVLVTGGAGFIGSNFVRHLLSGTIPGLSGASVTVLDSLTYAGDIRNLDPVAGDPRLAFVRGDVCDAPIVRRNMKGVSLVVHFAAETHVDRSIAGGDEFVRSNVAGTHVLLREAEAAGVDRFVLISTDEVYGSVDVGSWTEDSPLQPNSLYSAAKAGAEFIARAYHRTHGLPVCVVRASNNYGPYQFPEKMIPCFVTNLLDGEPIALYGDGQNIREWMHVDDHCRGIALVAEKGVPGEVYNIGGGRELTNIEVTSALLGLTGTDWSFVRYVADRKGHDRRYSIDSSKISNELGYHPEESFESGLADTVRWYSINRDWWEPIKRGARIRPAVAGAAD